MLLRTGPAGIPETIRDEHRQIEAALRRIEACTTELGREGGTREASVLRLLEEQYRFKQLLKHHNDREDRSLYPLLDDACSLDERRNPLRADGQRRRVDLQVLTSGSLLPQRRGSTSEAQKRLPSRNAPAETAIQGRNRC